MGHDGVLAVSLESDLQDRVCPEGTDRIVIDVGYKIKECSE